MKIFYGILGNNIEVTSICLSKLTSDNIITIPAGDNNRASHFTDPLFGVLKIIIITNNNKITTYNDLYTIKINLLTNAIDTIIDNDSVNRKLAIIQSSLKIKYGGFNEELPEQKMVIKYLKVLEKVFEICGNIGRN
jgi:hypothetical protein